MKDFVAIDFETANQNRVSACSLGIAKVSNGEITDSQNYLMKPVGGHAPRQTKIHKITEEHTFDKPDFSDLFADIKDIFDSPLVGHSLFDKQVLFALSNHFALEINFTYIDSSVIAKEKLPNLKNHELKTVAKHFQLPPFKHHDAAEDAIVCAKIYLLLQECEQEKAIPVQESDDYRLFKYMVNEILADYEISYPKMRELLSWLKKRGKVSNKHRHLYAVLREEFEEGMSGYYSAVEIKTLLKECVGLNRESDDDRKNKDA